MLIQDSETQKVPASINFELNLKSEFRNKTELVNHQAALRNLSKSVQNKYTPIVFSKQQT
jgi:hypothetical protein